MGDEGHLILGAEKARVKLNQQFAGFACQHSFHRDGPCRSIRKASELGLVRYNCGRVLWRVGPTQSQKLGGGFVACWRWSRRTEGANGIANALDHVLLASRQSGKVPDSKGRGSRLFCYRPMENQFSAVRASLISELTQSSLRRR